MIFCTYEDREGMTTGLKLLALSLKRVWPGALLHIFSKSSDGALRDWLTNQPHVRLEDDADVQARGWNVKPEILQWCLDHRDDKVVWLDSDLIFAGDPRPLLMGLDAATIVAAPERTRIASVGPKAARIRTHELDLFFTRMLPEQVNTCFLRVTRAHAALLTEWRQLMNTADYQAAQQQPRSQRPVSLGSDQDVLTALLGSERFADIPVRLLRRGHEMIHCGNSSDYPLAERLRNLHRGRRLPPVLHAPGRKKPWHPATRNRSRYEIAPFAYAAQDYATEMDEDTDWMTPRRFKPRVQCLLTGNNPHLRDLPQAGSRRSWSPRKRPRHR